MGSAKAGERGEPRAHPVGELRAPFRCPECGFPLWPEPKSAAYPGGILAQEYSCAGCGRRWVYATFLGYFESWEQLEEAVRRERTAAAATLDKHLGRGAGEEAAR